MWRRCGLSRKRQGSSLYEKNVVLSDHKRYKAEAKNRTNQAVADFSTVFSYKFENTSSGISHIVGVKAGNIEQENAFLELSRLFYYCEYHTSKIKKSEPINQTFKLLNNLCTHCRSAYSFPTSLSFYSEEQPSYRVSLKSWNVMM